MAFRTATPPRPESNTPIRKLRILLVNRSKLPAPEALGNRRAPGSGGIARAARAVYNGGIKRPYDSRVSGPAHRPSRPPRPRAVAPGANLYGTASYDRRLYHRPRAHAARPRETRRRIARHHPHPVAHPVARRLARAQ